MLFLSEIHEVCYRVARSVPSSSSMGRDEASLKDENLESGDPRQEFAGPNTRRLSRRPLRRWLSRDVRQTKALMGSPPASLCSESGSNRRMLNVAAKGA